MQSSNEIIRKYKQYLTEGQKSALKQREQQLSIQNALTRMQAQTSALRGVRKTNEMLTNYGLARSLARAPSSGMDENARRMPAFQSQMQQLRSLETAQLDQYGVQYANETIAARAAAARAASRRTVRRTPKQPSNSALADAINKAIASGMSEDDAAAAASKAYTSNDYSGFEAHYEAQDHYAETAIRNLNPILNTLDPRAASSVATLIRQKGLNSGIKALQNAVGPTDPREVYALQAKVASGKATANDRARLNAFYAQQSKSNAETAYTKQMIDMPYSEFSKSLSEAEAELDAALQERSKTYTDNGAKRLRRENGELVPAGDWTEADEKRVQALQAKVDRLKGYKSLRQQAQVDQYANLDDETLTEQEQRLSGYIKEIRESGYINGETDRVLEAEYQQKLDAIKSARTIHLQQKRAADYDDMMSITRNADFALKSQHGANASGGDLMHTIINGGAESEEVQRAANTPGTAGTKIRGDIEKASLMTPDEVAAYNYHFSNGGQKEADAYLDSLETYLHERRTQQLVAMVEADTTNSPAWLGTITHSLASILVNPAQITGTLYSIGQDLLGREIDPYHGAFTPTIYVNAVRTNSAEKITKEIYDIGGSEQLASAASFGYQTLMSVADNLYLVSLGGLVGGAVGGTATRTIQQYGTLSFMSSGAAATTIQNSLAKGFSQEEAMKLGLMAGSFEAIFEKVSLDNLLDMTRWQATPWILRALTQAGIEATEEGCTEIANLVSNYAVLGSRSDYEETVRMYMAQGIRESEARSMALMDMIHQVAMAMAGGALAGGLMGGMFAAKGNARMRSVGRTVQASGQLQTLLEEAQAVPSNRVQRLYAKINNAFTSNKKASNLAVGRLNYLVAQHNIEYANSLIDDAVKNGTIKARDAQLIKQAIEEDSFSMMPGSHSKAWDAVSPEAMAALTTVLQQEAVAEVTPNPEAAAQRASETGSQSFHTMQTNEERAQLDMQARGLVSDAELERFASVQDTIDRMQEEQYGLQVHNDQRGWDIEGSRVGNWSEGNRRDGAEPASANSGGTGVYGQVQGRGAGENSAELQKADGRIKPWGDQDRQNLNIAVKDFNAKHNRQDRADQLIRPVSPSEIDDRTKTLIKMLTDITGADVRFYQFQGESNGMYGCSIRGRVYVEYNPANPVETLFQAAHEMCEKYSALNNAGRAVYTDVESEGKQLLEQYNAERTRAGYEEGDENELCCDMFGAYMVERVSGLPNAYDQILGKKHDRRIDAVFGVAFDAAINNLQNAEPQTKELMAYHNLSPDEAREALAKGHIIMGSIAVAKQGSQKFGDISFLFDSSTINPRENSKNRLHGADAWTPQQNPIKKNAVFDDEKTSEWLSYAKKTLGPAADQMFNISEDAFKNLIRSKDGVLSDAYAKNLGMQAVFALENGVIEYVPMNPNGTPDIETLTKLLDERINTHSVWREYRAWMKKLSDELITSFDIASDGDILHNMESQSPTSKPFRLSPDGSLILPTVEYDTIDDLRENSDRLDPEADARIDEMSKKFMNYASQISERTGANRRTVINAINVASRTRYSAEGIVKSFSDFKIQLTQEEAQTLQDLFHEGIELPTSYFEAKPHRMLDMREVRKAVVPSDLDQDLINALTDLGIEVVPYEAGNLEDRLQKTDTAAQDVKFSSRTIADPQKALDDQVRQYSARPGTAVSVGNSDPNGSRTSFSTSTLGRWRDTMYRDYGLTQKTRQTVAKAEEMSDFILKNNGENGTPNIAQYAARGDMPYNSRGPLRKNIEYTYTFDIDANCERRLQYAAYLEKIQARLGRLLTLKESRQLVELMRAYEQMIPCTYCYVEGKRMQLSNYMLNFFETRQNVLNAETDDAALAQMYSYDETKKTISPAAQKVFDEWRSLKKSGRAQYNPTAIEHFYTVQNSRNNIYAFLDERYGGENAYLTRADGIKSFRSAMRGQGGATKATMRKALLDHFGLAKNSVAGRQAVSYFDAWFQDMTENIPHVLVGEIPARYAVDGVNADALALERDASNYAKSASQARNEDRYQPYTDQVRKISDKEKKNINARGGFRIHSSNDFQVQNILDYMQFFGDLATVGGWMSHTYTKNPAFVEIFGANKVRYNMSIAMYGDEASGIRANEQEGMSWRDAKRLRKKFNNAGTIAMVVNDDQLSMALNADWIDMIIPFHASGMEKAYWYNVLAWVDYTSRQNEAWMTTEEKREALLEKGVDIPPKATSAEVDALFKQNFKQIVDEKGNTRKPHFLPYEQKIGNTVIEGHNNDKDKYLALCKEYGVKPRFAGVMVKDANGNVIEITEHPNYIKVIKETSRTDTPQETVTADIDMEAAKRHLLDFANVGGYAGYQQDPYGIVNEFLSEYAGKNRDYGWLPERAEKYMEYRGVSRPVINAETRPGDAVGTSSYSTRRITDPLADQMYDMRKQAETMRAETEKRVTAQARKAQSAADAAIANQIADMRQQAKANRKEQQNNLDKITALNQRIERMEQARQRERESLLGRIDKKDTLVQEVRAARDRKLAEQKAQYTERLDAKNATIKDQRNKMKEMKVAERRKFAEQRERIQERQKREKRIKNITKNVRELASWLERPTKDAHVPDFMRGVVGDLVTLIDIGKEGKNTQKSAAWRSAMQTLSTSLNAYAARQAEGNSDHEAFMAMLPDGFTASLSQFVEAMTQNETQYLGDMSDEDIRTLNQVIGTVRGAVKGVNRMYSNMRYASIQEMAEKTIEDGSAHGRKRWRVKWADKLLNSSMLDAYSFGHTLGETGDAAIRAMSDGYFGKTVPKIRQALDFFEGLKDRYKVKAKDAKKWSDDVHEFDVEGGKVRMSTQQLMNLYALSFRPQALQHILGGGIQIAENEATRKSVDPKAIYKLSESDLDMMFDALTEEQKNMVSDMQHFLSVDAASWGNEVTQELYMFDGYGEEFYWPIESSPTSTGLKDPEQQRTFNAMMNSSFTKSLNHFANNPVVLRDVFSVFTEHCVQMANYNGLAIPIQDTMKWMNYKSRDKDGRVLHNKTVQLAIQRMGGEQATSYITTFLKDINGLNKSSKGSSLMSESVSRLKRAAIAGKIRVVIQQPTAVIRALSMVDAKHFVNTRNFSVKRSIKEMLDHAPIAWWKANGNYDIGIGRSMVDMFVGTTGLEGVTDFAMKPAGAADNLGWSWIWNAVRNEVKESRSDLKVGSDEFFAAVTERFNDVVSQTQVVDTPFHRAEIMRDKDSGVKQATAFASEPVKQYNMLYRAITDVAEGKPEAGSKVARTAAAVVLSQAINAVVTAAWDAARKRGDDDEKTYLQLFGKTWVENFSSNLNPMSNIVLLRDVWDTLKGEDPDVRMDLQNLASAVTAFRNVINRWKEGDSQYTDYYLYTNLAQKISDLAGLPFGGIYSSAESVVSIIFPDLIRKRKPKLTQEWQKDMLEDALAAGMRLGDFYDLYEDIGKQEKSKEAAQVLYESDLNADQMAIMAQRASESLDNSLAELQRRGASDKILKETIHWYSIKNGLVSHHDDPASEQLKRLLLDDQTLTAEEKAQIYTALTKESFTGIESKIFRSDKLSNAEKNALYKALNNKAEMEKILWDNPDLTDDERHSILGLGEPNDFRLDFSSADRLRLSSINETTYDRALKAEKNGVSNAAYLKYYDVVRKYAKDDSTLETGKADVLQDLMDDNTLTASQKAALETAMYETLNPKKADYKYTPADYTDEAHFYITTEEKTTLYPMKCELAEIQGFSYSKVAEYVKRYQHMKDTKTGSGKNGGVNKKDSYSIMEDVGFSRAEQKLLYDIMTTKEADLKKILGK